MRTPWLTTEYRSVPEYMTALLPVTIRDKKFYVLINKNYGSWVALSDDEYERYKNNELSNNEMESLYNRMLALDENGEFLSLSFPEPAERPSVVVVNITTTCNLRCKYCFVECEPGKGEHMQKDVMEAVVKNMLSMPAENITFELQGGDPLNYIEGFYNFVNIVEGLNKNTKKTIKLRTMTNAINATKEFAVFCKEHQITVGVSIDGPEAFHNIARVDENGEGTFHKTKAGIDLLRSEGVVVDGAVCTIGKHNINASEELLDFFDEIELDFKPRPVNILGRELQERFSPSPGEWNECFQSMHKLKNNYKRTNFSNHIHEENVYTPIRDYICLRYPCGAAREIISVNPDGSVYPCDGFKGVDTFCIGNLLKESLEDIFQKEEVKKIQQRDASTIDKCRNCAFSGMCCSCCYSTYGAYGTIYREDPLCNDRKKIFLYLIKDWIENNCL
jgi:radical SAM protein with 4Fe4S-binding SPASM domain